MQVATFFDWGNTFCGFGPSWGHGPWFMSWIFPFLFWLLIVYLVVSLVKSLLSRKDNKSNDAALEILRAKFAAGEIDETEYSSRKSVLLSK